MPRDGATGLRLHLLVQVIDNFGDAGVAWRLARALARDPLHTVELWIDQPELLHDLRDTAPLQPPFPGDREAAERIRVHRLDAAVSAPLRADTDPPAVFLSAFGTPLPAAWRARLAGHPRGTLWVNVEYLSAEDWVETCHGLASPKPADGAVEHFFYPGFTAATGGLLREPELEHERQAFLGGRQRRDWEARLGLAPAAANERRVSLFCYPTAPLDAWLECLEQGPHPVHLLACARTASNALQRWAGSDLGPGEHHARGALKVTRLPWLHPADFDRLLWTCDLNFVRGEDSWVRAQWAARPFVWQAYPQAEQAHHIKLEAFLARLPAGESPQAEAWRRWNRCWNGLEAADALPPAWQDLLQALPTLEPAWKRWADMLGTRPDLAAQLVRYCRDRL